VKHSLVGRPIVITGASSGIGLASAFACARAGMPVTLMARRADRLDDIARTINDAGGRAVACPGAVESVDDCERAIASTVQAFGSVYAVFANAGYGLEKDALLMSDLEIRAMFEVNFFGSLNIIRPAMDHFRKAQAGHILMCSSCLSKLGVPRYGCYASTKACQDYFGRAMRHELEGTGIHVSTVHPIRTSTELFDQLAQRSGGGPLLMEAPARGGLFVQTPEHVARAVVRCLERPRGEVWTSGLTRLALALSVALPRITDAVLARSMRRWRKRQGASSPGVASSG
jgi:short-subunit dehydrogenase